MNELKPCPFCGGEAKFRQEEILGLCAVQCKCQTSYQFDFQKAIEAWNRRANDE